MARLCQRGPKCQEKGRLVCTRLREKEATRDCNEFRFGGWYETRARLGWAADHGAQTLNSKNKNRFPKQKERPSAATRQEGEEGEWV